MQTTGFLEKVKTLATQVSDREGCILYDIEFVGGGQGRTLRVYIDKAEGAVSVDDCANVSRGLNLALDVEDVIPGGGYQLEVSSPGLERVLRQPWHFSRVLGQTVSVKTFAPLLDYNEALPALARTRQLTGVLKEVKDDAIIVQSTMGDVVVPYAALTKAHLIFVDPKAAQAKDKKAKNKK